MREAVPGEWADAELPLTLEDRRSLLASPIGHGLHPRDLAIMLAEGYASLATASKGDILALAAQAQREFFVVLAGTLEVARADASGGRHLLDVVGRGGACGAVTAFSDRPRWPAAVHVVEDARLLAISTAALLSDAAPSQTRQRLLQNGARLLAERARHLHARGELLVRRGLRERLAFYLLRQADAAGRVPLTMTRQGLADHLAVSRASMTRELGRMADEGLIAMRGRGFAVLDAAALARFAD